MLESEGIDSLERFRFAYSEEYDYKALVIRAGFWCNLREIPRATAQAADLTRAWTEVTGCYRRRIRKVEEPAPEADLDSPMPGNTLASARLICSGLESNFGSRNICFSLCHSNYFIIVVSQL